MIIYIYSLFFLRQLWLDLTSPWPPPLHRNLPSTLHSPLSTLSLQPFVGKASLLTSTTIWNHWYFLFHHYYQFHPSTSSYTRAHSQAKYTIKSPSRRERTQTSPFKSPQINSSIVVSCLFIDHQQSKHHKSPSSPLDSTQASIESNCQTRQVHPQARFNALCSHYL